MPPGCCSAVDTTIPARGRAVVSTDLSIAIPSGTYARVAPRSGLAVKHFIDTGAGVVDEDYRGTVGVVLFNHSDTDFAGAAPAVAQPITICSSILASVAAVYWDKLRRQLDVLDISASTCRCACRNPSFATL